MNALLDIILPVFLVIGFGYLAVWSGAFSDTASQALISFSQNFAIPLLLFSAIASLDLSAGFDSGLLLSYYIGSAATFFLCMFGARYLLSRDWPDSVAIGFCALFANSLLLGLSVTEQAFGADALGPNYAIVAVHAPFCYFLGITAMSLAEAKTASTWGTVRTVAAGMFNNPLMIGIILGFFANFSGLQLPSAVSDAFALLIRAALPTALFALGGVLYRYRPGGATTAVIWICALSLFVHPAIVLGLSTKVFDLPLALTRSAVITAAMAPGVNSFLFASMFGRAQNIAATAVLVGTAASVVSASFWLSVLQ